VLALFLGWFSHNDVAYDHTAVWLHVAAHVRGASDRWGRAVPPLLLGVPIVMLLAPVLALWSGIDRAGPALLGVSLGLLLTGIGVSSVASAAAPYPAPRPGAGPFDQPPLTAATAGWAQGLSMLAILLLMSPALVLAWSGLRGADELLPIAAGVGGATGFVVLVLGVLVGGRVFQRRAPELLDLVLRT
jgi:ABC-2 type transport system permease protein